MKSLEMFTEDQHLDDSLSLVTAANGEGVYASASHLYRNAVFGRDSLEVAEDILTARPDIVRNVLLTMSGLQGRQFNSLSEEEPGKILHEYRRLYINGEMIDDESRTIFERLSAKWGSEGDRMIYYGSIDSTPLFIKTLGRYCDTYGPDILAAKINAKDGQETSVYDTMLAAAECLVRQIKESPLKMLAYKRANPEGIANQAWKDSKEFFVHEDGERANHDGYIASIEVQGLAYDALLSAAKFIPEQSESLLQLADNLQKEVLGKLWQPDRQYFSLGLDQDKEGNPRIIKTRTANPAALLDTALFDNLALEDRHHYISAIVRQIFSPDFLTDAGIRSRALSAAHLVPYWDYHGSFVSWPKETYDIAKGLRRQGLPSLATQLENRLLNIVAIDNEYPEFVYIDGEGRVIYGSPAEQGEQVILIDSTNRPEHIQAWTISAIYAIKKGLNHYELPETQALASLEQEVLSNMPVVPSVWENGAVLSRYPRLPYRLSAARAVAS